MYVCVARSDGPRCGHANTRYLYYQEAQRPCDGERPRTVTRFEGHETRLRVSGAQLSFTRRRGTPEPPPVALRRRTTIEAFVSQPPTRWPRGEAPSAPAP